MAFIEIKNVKKQYDNGGEIIEALRGVNISIESGEFITIMGQPGSGKTTLLSVLGGLNHPTDGVVELAGIRLYDLSGEQLASFRAHHLGFVFRSFHLISYLTALENVMLPLAIAKVDAQTQKSAAHQALTRVGLSSKADLLPHQLSEGEQERVAIARAIAHNPEILLADEPTGNLDSTTSEEVMALFRKLNNGGQTVVMVTDNPKNGAYADRTISLRDGMVLGQA